MSETNSWCQVAVMCSGPTQTVRLLVCGLMCWWGSWTHRLSVRGQTELLVHSSVSGLSQQNVSGVCDLGFRWSKEPVRDFWVRVKPWRAEPLSWTRSAEPARLFVSFRINSDDRSDSKHHHRHLVVTSSSPAHQLIKPSRLIDWADH